MPLTTTILAFSDCLNIREDHDDTVLIQVSNANDFAGIVYSVLNPEVFNLRLHGRFFRERTPEENESEGLSDNQVVKLSGELKEQKLLEIEPMPYYMHNILKIALQQNTIFIDEELWLKEEAYDMQPLNSRSPFEAATVWLTRQVDGLHTNVYGESIDIE